MLLRSVRGVLEAGRLRVKVERQASSVVVEGPAPTEVADLFKNMPGVSWVAAGTRFNDFKELGDAGEWLGRRYLRRDRKFWVEAETSGEQKPSDVSGALTSSVLDAVKRSRVSQSSPRVVFRATFDGTKGAVGVELVKGPGGTPTGDQGAGCMVSGGKHSSVLVWEALLSGYKVTMVHAFVNDQSLRQVAKIYSEMSFRVDPRAIRLEVLRGPDPANSIKEWAAKVDMPVFGGFHAGCSDLPPLLSGSVTAPLYLLPEEKFDSEFAGLSIKGREGAMMNWSAGSGGKAKVSTFRGRADVNQVLDGLSPPRSPRS